MPKINRLYAYIAVDDPSDPTDEGVAAFLGAGGMMMPLIAADEARMLSLRSHAQQIATTFGRPLRLVVFETRRELGRVDP
jgi:hypothetical protein